MRLLNLKKHSIRLLKEKSYEIRFCFNCRGVRFDGGLCGLFNKHHDLQRPHGDMHDLLHEQRKLQYKLLLTKKPR